MCTYNNTCYDAVLAEAKQSEYKLFKGKYSQKCMHSYLSN